MKRSTYPLVLPFSFIHGNPWRHCWPASFSDFRLGVPGGKTSRYLWTNLWTSLFFSGSSQRSSLHTLGHMGFVHFIRLIEIHGRSSEIIIANVSLWLRCQHSWRTSASICFIWCSERWSLRVSGKTTWKSDSAGGGVAGQAVGCGTCFSNWNSDRNSSKPEKAFAVHCPTGSYRVPPETMENSDETSNVPKQDDLVLDIDLPVREHLPAVYHPLHS